MAGEMAGESGPLLDIRSLDISITRDGRSYPAVRDFSLSIGAGERLALVGESGCGKSITAFSIMGLLDSRHIRVAGGEVFLEGTDLLKLSEKEMRTIRGKKIGIIFQEPMTALNPVMPVGRQVAETILAHAGKTRHEAEREAIKLITRVGIRDPEQSMRRYPHEFSGGMRQRIMIAIAIACKPRLLIADEPTTALDATVEAQILALLRELQDEMGMSLLLITHNLALVSTFSERIAVMYAGDIVEQGPSQHVLENPLHPYTAGLVRCLPAEFHDGLTNRQRLHEIPGHVPSLDKLPDGCRFYERCERREAICQVRPPAFMHDPSGSSRKCIH
jgi:peptide/nickel transport system ATP-binding protein